MDKHKAMMGQAGMMEKNHVFRIFYLFGVVSADLAVTSNRHLEMEG